MFIVASGTTRMLTIEEKTAVRFGNFSQWIPEYNSRSNAWARLTNERLAKDSADHSFLAAEVKVQTWKSILKRERANRSANRRRT